MENNTKANKPQFYFCCAGQPASTFHVMTFSGTDIISQPYSFEIKLSSEKHDISVEDIIAQRATLFIQRNNAWTSYSGIISLFRYSETTVDYSVYYIKLVPRLWLLNLTKQTRIFQKMTIPDIVKQVLSDNDLAGDCEFNVKAGDYPEQEYIVQYQETDFNFINRLLEANGIWYFFQEPPMQGEDMGGKNNVEKMIITDDSSMFKTLSEPSTIKYRSISDMVQIVSSEFKENVVRMEYERSVIPKNVTVKEYNYRMPEVNLLGSKNIIKGDVGKVYEYGGSFKTPTEAQKSALILSNRIDMKKIQAQGKSTCRGLRTGFRFTLEEHVRSELNQPYVIVKVEHTGTHSSAADTGRFATYHNTFTCISSDRAMNFRPDTIARVPIIPGLIPATIEASKSNYANLDEQGRYKVRMAFDETDTENYKASKFIRQAQPYSGTNYGFHFPSHENTEMIMGCINGDPNKPLCLGTIPNANTISPVTNVNQVKNIIRTAGGNEMCMDDLEKKQKIHITTPDSNIITLDDANDNISIETTDKNRVILDDKNKKCFWNSADHQITMDYGNKKYIEIKTGNGHRINLSDTDKSIIIYTKDGNVIIMDDKGESIRMTDCKGTNTVTLDGKDGITMESKATINIKAEKDLNIQAQNTNIKSLKKAYLDTADEHTVKCGKAKTVLKKNGNTMISGKKINIKASSDIKMKGTKISEN